MTMNNSNNYFPLKKHLLISFTAFIVPIAVMTFAAYVIGLIPFGSNGFLVSDINNQFCAFYAYFKDCVTNGLSFDDLKYSLSKTLGGNMSGFWGYYLINPFLFILLLFPNEIISVGIYYMLAVMFGFMSLTFYLMLSDRSGDKWTHLIFSVGYALSGYCMAYMTIPGFFASLILLPLVIMGLRRICSDNPRCLLYILALAGAIICNYYIGYMICIFCGLYFLALILIRKSKTTVKTIMRFALSSCIAVILSLPILLPTISSLRGQKSLYSSAIFNFTPCYAIKSLVGKLFPGRFYCDFSNAAAPYIYVGIPIIICVILFVVNLSISLREKIVSLLFLAVLILCTYVMGLDTIWHGFNLPVGFSHRQAFVIVFLLLDIGERGLNSNRKVLVRLLPAALLIWQIFELSYNSVKSMQAYCVREMASQEEYSNFYLKNREIIDAIKASDDGLYRIEKDYSYNSNDSLLLSYAGLSHNSSCESDYIKQFAGRLGIRNQGIWTAYNQGSTSFVDSLLGVKYFLSRFDSTNKPYISVSDFGPTLSGNEIHVFRNPFALPLAWVSPKESDVDMTNPNLFEIQNEMAGFPIYTAAAYSEDVQGLNVSEEDVSEEITTLSASDYEVGVKNSGPGTLSQLPKTYKNYTISSENSEAFIEYKVNISSVCNLFCYFAAPCEQGCELYINGDFKDDYFSDYRWGIVNCGNYLPGDTVSIKLKATGDTLRLFDSYFYEENVEELAKWHDSVISDSVQITQSSNTHLSGTVSVSSIDNAPISSCDCTSDSSASEDATASKKTLVFSIPYDENLKIIIDGQEVEKYMIYDCLTAAKIAPGEHEFELIYN